MSTAVKTRDSSLLTPSLAPTCDERGQKYFPGLREMPALSVNLIGQRNYTSRRVVGTEKWAS